MNLKLVSYNSTNINDATNYNAFISDGIKLQGDARIIQVSRAGRRPIHASKVLQGYEMRITVQMLGTVSTQLDTLKALFDVEDETPRKLIAKDTANSDKQWYVYATTKDMPTMKTNKSIEVVLSVADPVWYENTESTVEWAITATADKQAVTVAGNVQARPRLEFTPTSAGGSRFGYRRLAIWRNPNTTALLNYPLNIVNTTWDTAALVADATNSVVLNGAINDSVTTITWDGETGTMPTSGMAYLGTEQISYTGKTATELTGVTRGINGTTAAAHDDDTVCYSSIIQADGDDIRVYVDGEETIRWFQSMNNASTKVWSVLDFQPGISMTLGTAIADSGDVDTITLASTTANKTALKNLPETGMVYIGTELFTYSGVNIKARRLTDCVREVKGTSAAAHAVGAAVYWIEHEIWIYYSNSSISAPETDDTYKPIIDLTSTNASWVYTSFADEDRLRAGRWTPALVKTANTRDPDNKSTPYTGNRTADADPATEMGMSLYAWQSGQVWKAENGTVEWSFYHPATITHVTASGEQYRATTNWPNAQLLKSKDGKRWTVVWTDSTPDAAATWEALDAHSAVELSSGYPYIKFSLSGRIGPTADNEVHYEIEGATLTLSSSGVPQGTLLTAEACYYMDATVTNNTTGEWLNFITSTALNKKITIDCENKIAYLEDGTPITNLAFSSVRRDWLNLNVGANELQFDDTGTGSIDGDVYWRDRNS